VVRVIAAFAVSFGYDDSGMKSLTGQLLIASPELADPNFAQTVTLMVQHDESGALGLVLNRPTATSIDEAWAQLADDWDSIAETPCLRDDALYYGGPCAGALMILHTAAELSQSTPCQGVYFSTEEGHLTQLVQQPGRDVRFFVGYAGWSAGQLESELATGSWLNTPATAELVFYEGDDLWSRVRDEIHRAIFRRMNVKELPSDPSMN